MSLSNAAENNLLGIADAKTLFHGSGNKKSAERRKLPENDAFPLKPRLANRLLAAQSVFDLERLASQMQMVSFKCGDILYRPNFNCEFIYFPENAVFSQLNILEDGKTLETAMIGNEGVSGLSSVLGLQTNNFWTQVSIAGKALRVHTDVFKREFISGGIMQKSFLAYLNSYINQISQRAVCNNHHRIEERFSTWLLMLDDRCQNHNLILTHEQIAQFLGVHRPSITNIAQNLRDSGIIGYIRGRIFILDRQKLENSACECYLIVK